MEFLSYLNYIFGGCAVVVALVLFYFIGIGGYGLFYRIGGYKPKTVKVGQLGVKFLSPGMSLMIVAITASWGGLHFADAITSDDFSNNWIVAIGFVSIILLVDWSLLQGNKTMFSIIARVLLALTVGFIVSILTCLVVFESDIKTKIARDIYVDVKSETASFEQEITYYKSLRSRASAYRDSAKMYIDSAYMAHRGEYIFNGERIGACRGYYELLQCPVYGNSFCWEFREKSAQFKRDAEKLEIEYDENKYVINDTTRIKAAEKGAEARNIGGIIKEIKDLWALMIDDGAVFVAVMLIFLFLMLVDLMPLTVKLGIKDSLDEEYKKAEEDLNAEEKDINELKREKHRERIIKGINFDYNVKDKELEAKDEIEIARIEREKTIRINLEKLKIIGINKIFQHNFDKAGKWEPKKEQPQDNIGSEDENEKTE